MPRHLRLPPFTPSRRYLGPGRASPQIRFEGDWTQAEPPLLQDAIADAEGRESSLRARPEITSLCRMDTRIARLCCGRARLEERAYRWAIAERVAGCYCVRRHVSRSSNPRPCLFGGLFSVGRRTSAPAATRTASGGRRAAVSIAVALVSGLDVVPVPFHNPWGYV